MRSKGGGRDGQMEEWDPRDVSFITPPCNLHSFTLSSLSFSHHPFDRFSSSTLFLRHFSRVLLGPSFRFFPPSLRPSPSQFVGARFKVSLSPLATSLRSSFHPSVFFRSCHFHFPCQQEERNLKSVSLKKMHASEGTDGRRDVKMKLKESGKREQTSGKVEE